jgi:type IV secretory pathway TrbL component
MKGKNVTMLSGASLVGLFLVVTEAFLALRFILHFFAVDPTNGFAQWVFHSTDGILTPWRGTFTQTSLSGHPHYVDLPVLFIMVAYAVVAGFMMWAFKHYGDVLASSANGRRK